MLFNKLGLYGKSDIDPEISVRDFRSYEYTNKDSRRYYDTYNVLSVETTVPFKIFNSVLIINNEEYNIGNKTLHDVHDILNKYGKASFFTGFEDLSKLPAILLEDCSNLSSESFDGFISPFVMDSFSENESITALTEVVSNVTIFDTDTSKTKKYVRKNTHLYYDPSITTKVCITRIATRLYLKINFAPRRVTNEEDSSYLLNFTSEETE